MDMALLLQWLEALASIAVLITLIYLARQVHQENILMRSEARQALVATDQEQIYKFIEHPDLARSFAGKQPATEDEKTRMNFWIVAAMRAREFEWTQYRSGALDKETWEGYAGVIYFVLGTERARGYWELCKGFFNQGFVAYVDDKIADVPPGDYWDQVEKIP
ncbi:MAG: hypothetical protein QNJ40_12870 [Xanthomonadales bacterium]|nr:hypothetical protein [Xanthomonadales bacterium]